VGRENESIALHQARKRKRGVEAPRAAASAGQTTSRHDLVSSMMISRDRDDCCCLWGAWCPSPQKRPPDTCNNHMHVGIYMGEAHALLTQRQGQVERSSKDSKRAEKEEAGRERRRRCNYGWVIGRSKLSNQNLHPHSMESYQTWPVYSLSVLLSIHVPI
jgi:hypothetical protein